MMRNCFTVAVFLLLLAPAAARGQNREHLQMTADLQILQEHVSRLQLAVNTLDKQLEATNARIDAAAGANVKGFADQQLMINQLTTTLNAVRERLDDNSVRVSQMSQEFVAIREGVRRLTEQINTLVSVLQPEVQGATPSAGGAVTPPPAAGEPSTPPDGQVAAAAPPGLAPVILPQSASYIFQQAMGDYRSQRYENAIEGFREVIKTSPDSPDAAEAQFVIGESFYYWNNDCRSAIPEYQAFVQSYPDALRRDEGLLMLGVCYNIVNQRSNAQRSFQQVIREYPNSASAAIATQRLGAMGIKPQ